MAYKVIKIVSFRKLIWRKTCISNNKNYGSIEEVFAEGTLINLLLRQLLAIFFVSPVLVIKTGVL